MFYSILFESKEKEVPLQDAPSALYDLHLDRYFTNLLKEIEKYELDKHYYTMLSDVDTIYYRQEILKDLENEEVLKEIKDFSFKTGLLKKTMDNLRSILKTKGAKDSNYLTYGLILEAAKTYTEAILELTKNWENLPFKSRGFIALKEYLKEYSLKNDFKELVHDVNELREAFDNIPYTMEIKGGHLKVSKYAGEESLTDEINDLFSRFYVESNRNYAQKLTKGLFERRIEVSLVNCLAKIYKDEYKLLETFCKKHQNFDDDILLRFSKEVQFYLGWIESLKYMVEDGLPFCYPEIIPNKQIEIDNLFDIALATNKLSKTVLNDVKLKKKEHILVITWPNQGGKTTFSRAIGQIHYLATLGLSVPGTKAKISLIDGVLTHFEKEETIETLNGKLMDELERLQVLRKQATKNSLLIINEIFASTTSDDAKELGGLMMKWLSDLGVFAIVVTFLDELATFNPEVLSLMTTVDENHNRIYKIIPKLPDGNAYASDIQEKYNLTLPDLERRLAKWKHI